MKSEPLLPYGTITGALASLLVSWPLSFIVAEAFFNFFAAGFVIGMIFGVTCGYLGMIIGQWAAARWKLRLI